MIYRISYDRTYWEDAGQVLQVLNGLRIDSKQDVFCLLPLGALCNRMK